jgi:hypothetical protein
VHAIYDDDLPSVTKCHMSNRQRLPSDFNAQRRRIIQHTAHLKRLSNLTGHVHQTIPASTTQPSRNPHPMLTSFCNRQYLQLRVASGCQLGSRDCRYRMKIAMDP